MRFLEEKLVVKHQVTAGNHLVITCFCFLSADLRLGINLGSLAASAVKVPQQTWDGSGTDPWVLSATYVGLGVLR